MDQLQDSVAIPESLLSLLRNVKSISVLTGSGISAESGIPTFRQAQTGMWSRYDPHDLATPQAFQRNPKLVWEWYIWRRHLVAEAEPNPGHYALVELDRLVPALTLITQNVDGLHQKAGSSDVIELHGNISRSKCFEDNRIIQSWDQNEGIPPRCPTCGGMLRPDVVWFGESLPHDALQSAYQAVKNCDLFFSIGTSAQVQPAASLAPAAAQGGAKIVEINLAPTPLSHMVDYILLGSAGLVLPALLKATFKE